MKTNIENLEDGKIKVSVTVASDDVKSCIDNQYKSYAKKYTFRGFRPGKAPKQIIDQHLGKGAVVADATEKLINDVLPSVIDDNDLFLMGDPDFVQADPAVYGEDYTFAFTSAVKPSFDLSSYDPVEVKLPKVEVTEDDIDAEIKEIMQSSYDFEDAGDKGKIKSDGFAEIKLSAKDQAGNALSNLNSDSRLYSLGMGMLPVAFDNGIVGLKKGD
ncbi:MAG: trigger factor family protein [Eggerthellaceae bacterium]|nr:trigger factor family protein [Eggerthellaceae bacterium]